MLGDRLKNVREGFGLSQTEFADRCGITMRSQRNYEKGERQPDAGYLLRIHQEFGVDVTWLLTGVGNAPQAMESNLRPDEAALLDNYRNSPAEGKAAIRTTSAAFAQSVAKKSAG